MVDAASQTPIGAQNTLFRRGVILGLTLAEISLLIVFVLLLVFAGILKKAQADLAQQDALRRETVATREQLRRVLADYAPSATGQAVDEWVDQLVSSSVRQAENVELKDKLRSTEATLDRIVSASERVGLANGAPPVSDRAKRWEQAAEAIEASAARVRATEAVTRQLAAGDKGAVAKAALETRLENEQLRGAVANAQRKLDAAGRGTEKPACWANAQGRPEYIFDITLSAGGIRLHDRKLPHRRAQEAILPISMIDFDRTLSADAFRVQTRTLFDWGEARGCRFFVVALDGTGPAEKAAFKQRLRQMEEHFYKFLAN